MFSLMFNQFRKLSFWAIMSGDIIILVAAHLIAYLIRFEGQPSLMEWNNIKAVLPALIPFKIGVFFFFGLYRSMWRYTGLIDLRNILKACLVTTFTAMGIILITTLCLQVMLPTGLLRTRFMPTATSLP